MIKVVSRSRKWWPMVIDQCFLTKIAASLAKNKQDFCELIHLRFTRFLASRGGCDNCVKRGSLMYKSDSRKPVKLEASMIGDEPASAREKVMAYYSRMNSSDYLFGDVSGIMCELPGCLFFNPEVVCAAKKTMKSKTISL